MTEEAPGFKAELKVKRTHRSGTAGTVTRLAKRLSLSLFTHLHEKDRFYEDRGGRLAQDVLASKSAGPTNSMWAAPKIEIRYDYPQWRHVYVPEEARS